MEGFKQKGKLICTDLILEKGKCFEINGEIFACGEVVSPTAAGIEKGQIFSAAPSYYNIEAGRNPARPEIPDISLLASMSDECLSPHSYKVPESVESSESWDRSTMQDIGRKRKPSQKEKTVNIFSYIWKMNFNSGTLFPSKVDKNGLITCPQCSHMLLHRKNAVTQQKFPPFCSACNSYFVKEGEVDNNELDSLACCAKGKIVVLEKTKNAVSFPALCGIAKDVEDNTGMHYCGMAYSYTVGNCTNTTPSIGCDTAASRWEGTGSIGTISTQMSITDTLDETMFSKDVIVESEDTISYNESLQIDTTMSIRTEEEEMVIREDLHQV